MTDLVAELGGWAAIRRAAMRDDRPPADPAPRTGRHAIDEDALLTPIFHALARRGRADRPERSRRPSDPAPDPALAEADFHRDPLTAPIPVQVLIPEPSRSPTGRHQVVGRRSVTGTGRHHRIADADQRVGRASW